MAMNYLQFDFETAGSEQGEILLALLADAGFESFEEEENCLKAFIRKDELDLNKVSEIISHIPVSYSQKSIEPENWNEKWESGFEPVRVGDFAAIRAGFHETVQGVRHEIIITPKMSFGTGHHATTYMMVEQMAQIDFTGKQVFDFGTGTGVLAILAEKMGASSVTAIDNDEWSITNANENILANACSRISLQLAGQLPAGESYDIILANINLNVIRDAAGAIGKAAKKGAQVLLSGFLVTDELEILKALAMHHFHWVGTSRKGDWSCVGLKKS
jgi:ribosomal protein L11 methyltransferase